MLLLTLPVPAEAVKFSSLDTADKRDFYLHAATGYALAFTGSAILKKKQFSTGKSILVSSLFTTALLLAKEKFIDASYSNSDMAGNLVGVGTAGLTFFLIEF